MQNNQEISFKFSDCPTLQPIQNVPEKFSFSHQQSEFHCFCGLSFQYQKLKSENQFLRNSIKLNNVTPTERRFSKNPIDREIESLKAKNKELKDKIRSKETDYTSIDIGFSGIEDQSVYIRELELSNQKLQHQNKVLSQRVGNRLKGM